MQLRSKNKNVIKIEVFVMEKEEIFLPESEKTGNLSTYFLYGLQPI